MECIFAIVPILQRNKPLIAVASVLCVCTGNVLCLLLILFSRLFVNVSLHILIAVSALLVLVTSQTTSLFPVVLIASLTYFVLISSSSFAILQTYVLVNAMVCLAYLVSFSVPLLATLVVTTQVLFIISIYQVMSLLRLVYSHLLIVSSIVK